MSNTYYQDEQNDITLTAFIGGEYSAQITIGMCYTKLTNDDCIRLAGALLERATMVVSATGYEESNFNKPEL